MTSLRLLFLLGGSSSGIVGNKSSAFQCPLSLSILHSLFSLSLSTPAPCVCLCLRVSVYVCMYLCVSICACVCMSMCACVSVCLYVEARGQPAGLHSLPPGPGRANLGCQICYNGKPFFQLSHLTSPLLLVCLCQESLCRKNAVDRGTTNSGCKCDLCQSEGTQCPVS